MKNESPISEKPGNGNEGRRRSSDSFCFMNSESLQICTEGLGSESLDDFEDLMKEGSYCSNSANLRREKGRIRNQSSTRKYLCLGQYKRAKSCGRAFPPPISCIGTSGKPCVCFESFRRDGRFVLREVRIPTQELFHACREDGRLRLCLVQPDDYFHHQEEVAVAKAEGTENEGAGSGNIKEELENDVKEKNREQRKEV
ncbi:hypothetical protein Nepgr_014502 [Nepenthes gracilis]|uniref:FAF domain-containing protein n=1 Tax=Nepenthes gracilis TaxID=150966 RepID=A0AAD3XQD2_NEPGR|nr:hypothetical protein Nepgr_014502 [Nepenthes gracilis]